MQVFWQRGYDDASLPDLLNGMGLTRGSLYKAFKDKKTLFLLVLERYEAEEIDAGVAMLTDASVPDGRERVLALFAAVADAAAQADHRGCLLCTAASGAAVEDQDIAAAVHRGLAKLQGALETALSETPSLADHTADARQALAGALLTQYVGLRTLGRSRLPLGIVTQSVQGAERMLRP
jgi:TetR/AcrR family transcriptional repressor of nem operon